MGSSSDRPLLPALPPELEQDLREAGYLVRVLINPTIGDAFRAFRLVVRGAQRFDRSRRRPPLAVPHPDWMAYAFGDDGADGDAIDQVDQVDDFEELDDIEADAGDQVDQVDDSTPPDDQVRRRAFEAMSGAVREAAAELIPGIAICLKCRRRHPRGTSSCECGGTTFIEPVE
ncbi:MAG: hypothetical protein K0U84_14040 [Actinomycetia bacterium]|nr:hypothetical protein [Actinomycetes bacterium]